MADEKNFNEQMNTSPDSDNEVLEIKFVTDEELEKLPAEIEDDPEIPF